VTNFLENLSKFLLLEIKCSPYPHIYDRNGF
jgi:hypothetical protein